MQVYRRESERQECAVEAEVEQRRPVEIMTSNTQTPKQDWLNIVTTSKARTKIRQALKEMVARQHAFAKETLERKFKNRKLEYDEATMMRLIKRLGFKNVTEFYQRIADGGLDVNEILDKYIEQQNGTAIRTMKLFIGVPKGIICKPRRRKRHLKRMYW